MNNPRTQKKTGLIRSFIADFAGILCVIAITAGAISIMSSL
jgi:hypothetical protein